MNVFDIIVESDFKVVKASNGFNIVGPNGQVVGTEKIPGTARAKAAELNKSPLTVNNGKINLKLPNGKVVTDAKPSEVVKKSLGKKAIARIKATSAGRIARFIGKSLFLKLTLGAQGAAILTEYYLEVDALDTMWESTYPKGHTLAKGSPYAQEAYDKILNPIRYATFAQAATVMTLTVSRLIKAGRVRRIVSALHVATAPLMAVPGIGWFAKAVLFALTEGAIWAAGWAVNRYGRELFHYILNNEFDEMLGDAKDLISTPEPAKEIDVNAVKAAIKKELQAQKDGTIPKPPKPGDAAKRLKGKGVKVDKIEIPD